jgi:hypothetical protein
MEIPKVQSEGSSKVTVAQIEAMAMEFQKEIKDCVKNTIQEVNTATEELNTKIKQQETILSDLKKQRDFKVVEVQLTLVIEFINQLKPYSVSFGGVYFIDKMVKLGSENLMCSGWTFSVTLSHELPTKGQIFPYHCLAFTTSQLAEAGKKYLQEKINVAPHTSVYKI